MTLKYLITDICAQQQLLFVGRNLHTLRKPPTCSSLTKNYSQMMKTSQNSSITSTLCRYCISSLPSATKSNPSSPTCSLLTKKKGNETARHANSTYFFILMMEQPDRKSAGRVFAGHPAPCGLNHHHHQQQQWQTRTEPQDGPPQLQLPPSSSGGQLTAQCETQSSKTR